MDYANKATEIRKTVLSMLFKAQTSHIGSNFGCIDILTVLYEKLDPAKDKLIISKGWVAASIYALNVSKGYMPQEAVDTYCQDGSPYIGLIEPLGYFGCEFAGGSMGYGLPAGVGFALAKKMKGEEGKVYVLMSDGEQAIGTTWESMLIAAQHKLSNLLVIVDNNGFQAMGKTQEILDPYLHDFAGWEESRMDGHDHEGIDICVFKYGNENDTPSMIFADTIKGRGVSFMENNNLYHYKQLSDEEYQKALIELNG